MSRENLKVGVIGLGVGEEHITGYSNHPNCSVIKICDFDNDVASAAQDKYPSIEVTMVDSEILNDPDIDIVSIASYDHLHFDQIVTGLNNGKHLFVEKPLVLLQDHAWVVWKKLQTEKKLKISSNLVMRKMPRFKSLKQMLDQGDLGRLSYISAVYHYGRLNKLTEGWRGESKDYSITLGGGIHIIDLLLWLTGDRVVSVVANGNNIHSKNSKFVGEDLVIAQLQFESGLLASVAFNFGAVTPHFHQIEVFGTKASFMSNADEAHLYTDRDPKNGDFNYLKRRPKFDSYTGKINLDNTYGSVSKGLHIQEFVDAIIDGRDPAIDKEQIFNSMSVCFAIESSLKSGKREPIKYYNQ